MLAFIASWTRANHAACSTHSPSTYFKETAMFSDLSFDVKIPCHHYFTKIFKLQSLPFLSIQNEAITPEVAKVMR